METKLTKYGVCMSISEEELAKAEPVQKKWLDEAIEKMNKRMRDDMLKSLGVPEMSLGGIPVRVDPSLPDSHPGYMIAHNLGVAPIRPGHVVYAGDVSDGEDYSFIKGCHHQWECDYESAFIKKKYYSCKHCKIKQEDV